MGAEKYLQISFMRNLHVNLTDPYALL